MTKFLAFVLVFLIGFSTAYTQKDIDLFVFTKTNGFRHESISDGVYALWTLGRDNDWGITFSEDSTDFTDENLKRFDAIIFLSTTMNVLGSEGELAFEKYINNGGGFVGLHAATDTEYDWEFYKKMIGAQFSSHPKTQEARLIVHHNSGHPAVAHLDSEWIRTDEWYNFKDEIPSYVNVLLELDETSTTGKKMNTVHPISWYHTYEGGRVFYTGLGHTPESFQEEAFLKHLEEGIKWSANITDVPVSKTWKSLLDEKFTLWDKFIGVPHTTVELEGYEKSADVHVGTPIGLNNDVKNVFKMIKQNGEDVLHVSGEIYGGLTTKQEYSNYHLKLKYKWGQKQWEPRLADKRDSGLLYHCTGKHGAFWNVWMRTLEMQIQEGDTGDLFALAGANAYVYTEPSDDVMNYKFKAGGEKYPVGENTKNYRCVRSEDHEFPNDQWNSVELYSIGGNAIHVVNGKIVNVIEDGHIFIDGERVPLTKGKIQLQSEAAEIFFKDIHIKALTEYPKSIKKAAGL